jgi:hypothetical protein
MRRELYINNRLADIEGVSIPLNFACSEIADLSGVSGNYSLTVKLPLTGNNILIAYFANLPNTTPAALWPGYRTTASYFIDGVPIFQNADVRLLSTEKSIDIQVTFGNLAWLDVLANIKLKDIVSEFIDPYVFNWNYWVLDNETADVRWLMFDWGGTFESGVHTERMHPSINVVALWDAIWLKLVNLGVAISAPGFAPEPDLWLPIMSQVVNPALRTGSEFNLTVETNATSQISEQYNFDLLDITEPFNFTPGITFLKGTQRLFIIPKTGKYRIRFDIDIKLSAGNSVSNSAGIWLRMQKYGDISYYPDLILSQTWLNTTGNIIVNAVSDTEVEFTKGDLIYIDCTIFQSGGSGYLLNVVIDSGYPIVRIEYSPVLNKKEQLEFLMPYDIAYNMPDISCKDFVKAIMQLYGLLVENKSNNIENSPVMFNLDSLTGTTYENWSDKLVSFDRPKIEWNLGFKQRNYLRYAEDETDNIFEDSYFTTYETDNAEKDLFKSIFAATDDVSLIGTTLPDLEVCSIPQWVVDGETYKFEGKCKQRIVRAYQTGTTFEAEVVQLFGEGYDPILITETAYISYFKTIPAEITDTGQGLDMASIMAKYYTGFIQAVKSNRLFTFQFLLNQIDINKFTHITPVWIEKFSNFFFAKKILNWEAGRVCNVEMLQLRDSGAVGVVDTFNNGLLYNYFAAVDERNITSAGEFVVPSAAMWQTLREYVTELIGGGILKETGIIYWDTPNTGAINEVGFNARGSGVRAIELGFAGIKQIVFYITTTLEEGMPVIFEMFYNSEQLNMSNVSNDGVSIRLVRQATPAELLLPDGTACANYIGNDLKQYPTVKIGTQVWLAANLAETMFRTGVYIPGFDAGVYTPFTNAAWAALTTAGCCAYNDDTNNI